MTPEEFEKMVKDYAENGIPEGHSLICLHGGMKTNFGTIYGKSRELIATIVMIMQEDEAFAKVVRLACDFYKLLGESEKEAEAAETVSKYLDRMGFRKEE